MVFTNIVVPQASLNSCVKQGFLTLQSKQNSQKMGRPKIGPDCALDAITPNTQHPTPNLHTQRKMLKKWAKQPSRWPFTSLKRCWKKWAVQKLVRIAPFTQSHMSTLHLTQTHKEMIKKIATHSHAHTHTHNHLPNPTPDYTGLLPLQRDAKKNEKSSTKNSPMKKRKRSATKKWDFRCEEKLSHMWHSEKKSSILRKYSLTRLQARGVGVARVGLGGKGWASREESVCVLTSALCVSVAFTHTDFFFVFFEFGPMEDFVGSL